MVSFQKKKNESSYGVPARPDADVAVLWMLVAIWAGTHRKKKLREPVVNDTLKVTSDGLNKAMCQNVRYDLMKLDQDVNDIHVAEILSQSKVAIRMELTLELMKWTPSVCGHTCSPTDHCLLLDHQSAKLSWRCSPWA